MYAEFANDPKVQMLSETDQRRFLMIMCLRCCNGDVTLLETEIAFQLRISDEDWQTTKNILYKKGLIDFDNKPVKWESRQFDSDTSNARVAKHRALQKTKQTTNSNADVTLLKHKSNAPETETETETEKKNTPADKSAELPPGFAKFWEAWPTNDRKQAKGKCLEAWKKAKAEPDAAFVIDHVLSLKSSAWLKDGGQFVPAPLVYLNQRRWEGTEASQQATGILAGAI